ncbi:MAG: alpha/beta hydrolase [Sedimenticolaceae bacterium]
MEMYVVTNREVIEGESSFDQFGKRPNNKGPNELRLAEVVKRGTRWSVTFLDDELEQAEVEQLKDEFQLAIDPAVTHYASLRVACDLARSARDRKRHVLFYIHGYNNDMKDVIGTAHYLENRYGVDVFAFSWPADGGGVSGTFNYKSDKRDARASAGALDRVLAISFRYFKLITEARRLELYEKARKKFPEKAEVREDLYVRLLEKDCPFTVNALFHSMGNYLLKQVLKSTSSEGNHLLFDNVILCQADANNLEHDLWVDQIRFRNRLYVTINEDDYALRASRAKAGTEQLARLGHYVRNLTSRNAHYINFTDASWVKSSHSPFAKPAEKNDEVFEFFAKAFSGGSPEDGLRYFPEGNFFALR